MMIPKPNLEELLDEVLSEITKEAGITNTQKGSISRILSESYLKQIVNLYDYVDNAVKNISLSTANGAYLDYKGSLFGCERSGGTETDNNYRYRISKKPFTIARENLDDLEESLLQISGIKKVYIDEYGSGGGSFNVYIFTNEANIPNQVLTQAQSVCENHKAFGVLGEIKAPEKVYVSMSLLIKPNGSADVASIKSIALGYLKDIIDNTGNDTTINFIKIVEGLNSTLGSKTIIIDDIKLNNDSIYNHSSYDVNKYSRLVFDDLAVTLIE